MYDYEGQSPIYSLPLEIWRLCLAPLSPDQPSVWQYRVGRWEHEWDFLEKRELWDLWKEKRRDLESLCRTSKTMAAIISPFLFESVAVVSRRGLERLSDLLINRPRIGEYVRELYCFFIVARRWQHMVRGDRHLDEEVQGFSSNSELTNNRRKSSVDFLEGILDKTPNITGILLSFPMGFSSLKDRIPRICRLIEPTLSIPSLNGLDCSKLKTLQLRRDITKKNYRSSWNEGAFDCDIMQYLCYLPSLESLESCADMEGTWELPGFEDWLMASPQGVPFEHPSLHLPHLRHLRLYGSRIREVDLVGLCLACTNLQTLLVHFEMGYADFEKQLIRPGRTLNNALLQRARSLHSLELLGPVSGSYLTPEDGVENSPMRRLDCVPSLLSLRHLSLDFRAIYGRPPYLKPESIEALSAFFPPSLTSLEITCEWAWYYPEAYELDWEDIATTLTHFQRLYDKRELPPQLRSLTFAMCSMGHAHDPRHVIVPQTERFFANTPIRFKIAPIPARLLAVPTSHPESDQEWRDERFEENDRRASALLMGSRNI